MTPTTTEIDLCARIGCYIDNNVTKQDFIDHIFPDREHNGNSDWDNPGEPYNHMYKRYLTLHTCFPENKPEAAYIDEWTNVRFLRWYERVRGKDDPDLAEMLSQHDGVDRFRWSWYLFKRLSADIGMLKCTDLCDGDWDASRRMFDRFVATGRRGSHFWTTCSNAEKDAILRQHVPADARLRRSFNALIGRDS
jgi:hypothetical protein